MKSIEIPKKSTRVVIPQILNELNEEKLNEIARETAKNVLVDISLFLRGGFSLASISDIAETWLRMAQMPYRLEINENSCRIVVEHDMGLKYSYLIREISRYLLEVAFESNSSCNITENTVIINLELARSPDSCTYKHSQMRKIGTNCMIITS